MRAKSRQRAQSGRGYQLRGQGCIQPIHDSCSHPSGPQAPNQPSWRLRDAVGRTPKENPTTYSRHRETRGTVGSVRAKCEQGLREVEPSAAFVASSSSPSDLLPVQHEADGCGLPASSTGPIRAKRRRGGASLAVSSPKEAAKKWALRAPSRAQRRQRRPHGRALPPRVDASRSELANPALRGPNAKRAPGRPVRPYKARCASLRGRPPLTTSGAHQ